MRLRQIALAATDLSATVAALTDVLGIAVSFKDPGVAVFGLDNAVMPVGQTFLEVVSPVREDATAKRWIEKRGGDAGYMVILQCEDFATLDAEVARAKDSGARVVWEGDHEGARTSHFHPRDLGAILSFDAMPTFDEWRWAGPNWETHIRTDRTTAIVGAELASPDPESLAARWSTVVGIPVSRDTADQTEISLPLGGRLVFVQAEDGGEGLVGVELSLADPDGFASAAATHGVLGSDGTATIAGTRFIPIKPEGS